MLEFSNLVGVLAAATGTLGVLAATILTLVRVSKKRKIQIRSGSKVFVISDNMTAEEFKNLTELLAPFAVKDDKAATEDDNGPRQ
jgi:hypothetical protein